MTRRIDALKATLAETDVALAEMDVALVRAGRRTAALTALFEILERRLDTWMRRSAGGVRMKLSDLRRCDHCGEPLGLVFGVVRCSLAVVAPTAAREVLGVAAMLGARGLGIAEALAPDPDGAIVVTGDHDATLRTERLLCQTCYHTTPLTLGALVESRRTPPAGEEGSRGSD